MRQETEAGAAAGATAAEVVGSGGAGGAGGVAADVVSARVTGGAETHGVDGSGSGQPAAGERERERERGERLLSTDLPLGNFLPRAVCAVYARKREYTHTHQ